MYTTKGLIFNFIFQGILFLQVVSSTEDLQNCSIVCGRDYNPVCGIHQGTQKTFSNQCMMTFHNCKKSTEFTFLQKGECPEESKDDKQEAR